MAGSRASRRRSMTVLATGSAAAVLVAGCTRPPRPPVPTTTAPTTVPATTTTMPGEHGGDDHGEHGGVDDKGWSLLNNGHQHGHGEVPLDAATQQALDAQLALTAQVGAQFPTLAQATAAGYRRGGPFSPGLGTHFLKGASGPGAGPITDDQILDPVLIFAGDTPDSVLTGYMYMANGLKTEPEGFAGPNDHWHYHSNVCIKMGADGGIDVPLGADKDVTPAQCSAVGGILVSTTGYMVHVWTVPGWENPDGVFAELNPKITCKDGTYWTIPLEQVGTNKTLCRDEAVIG
jgi:hypothetical protein